MPDIAMCGGIGCSVRETCYRHMAKPNEYWQAWMPTPDDAGPNCASYMRLMPRKEPKMEPNDKLSIVITGADGAEKWSTNVEVKPDDVPEIMAQLGEVTQFFRVIAGEDTESAGEG